MNLEQIKTLVGLVAANDGRTIGESDAVIWTAAIGDMDYRDCEAAVLDHVREGTGWLTPAMVRKGATSKAKRRLFQERQTALGGTPGICGVPGCDCGPVPVEQQRVNGERMRRMLGGTFKAVQ